MLAITIIGFAAILIWLIYLTVRNSMLKQELEKSQKELFKSRGDLSSHRIEANDNRNTNHNQHNDFRVRIEKLEGLNLKDNLQELSSRIGKNALHYGLIKELEERLDEQSKAIKSLQEHKNTLKQFVMDCLIEFEGKLK